MPSPLIAIVAAVNQEIDGLLQGIGADSAGTILGQPFWRGALNGCQLLLALTGIGKVNAAAATAWLLAAFKVSAVWHLGCAGSYADGPLAVGDVLLSDPVWCGDEGVLTRAGIRSPREIGIPLLRHRGQEIYEQLSVAEDPLFQQLLRLTPPGRYRLDRDRRLALPVSSAPGRADSDQSSAAPSEDWFRFSSGPSVTLGLVSGEPEVAHERFIRYGAWAENLEGSAVVQTCLRAAVPVIECRAISNTAGDRDKHNWRLEGAMNHCHALVHTWLQQFNA